MGSSLASPNATCRGGQRPLVARAPPFPWRHELRRTPRRTNQRHRVVAGAAAAKRGPYRRARAVSRGAGSGHFPWGAGHVFRGQVRALPEAPSRTGARWRRQDSRASVAHMARERGGRSARRARRGGARARAAWCANAGSALVVRERGRRARRARVLRARRGSAGQSWRGDAAAQTGTWTWHARGSQLLSWRARAS